MARIAISSPRGFHPPVSGAPAASALGPSLWTAFSWIGVALLLGAGAFSLYLIQISSLATAGYELQRLETERQGWLARNEQLELEIAKRRSLAWVEDQAVYRLGMIKVDRPTYVIVDGGWGGRGIKAGDRDPSSRQPPTPDPQKPAVDPLASAIADLHRAVAVLDALRHSIVSVLRPHP